MLRARAARVSALPRAQNPIAVDQCPARTMPCKAGQYLDDFCRCRTCPNGLTSPYSPSKPFPNVGINSCKPCNLPFRIFKCPDFLSKNCKSLNICVKPGDKTFWRRVFATFRLPKFAIDMVPLMYPDIYEAPTFIFIIQNTSATAPKPTEANAVSDVQDAVAACDIDAVGCCLPGTYGPNANNCSRCPHRHSSPYGNPSDDCSCPNTSADSCKPCNICEILDASNQCVSKCTLTAQSECSLRDVIIKTFKGTKRSVQAGQCYNFN